MTRHSFALAAALAASLFATTAYAAADCSKVSFSDVGWTDITSTTSTTKQILQALGYTVDVKVLSVPVTFESLARSDVDIFLGNWMPSQDSAIAPYTKAGTIDTVGYNLDGTIYNLAVPDYTYAAGLVDYDSIAKFHDQVDGKIYGIEPGNEANEYLIKLGKANTYNLGNFKVVESSEQGMLAQVKRAVDAHKDIIFLGWEPHPMNSTFKMKYLKGGEDFFGGLGKVYTVTRKGYVADCPNVGKLLQNLKFTLPMENDMMGKILNDGETADKATLDWMKAHPDVILAWLDGVTTIDGKDGAAAVKTTLGL
jgi:glycine betaine/proline transport system substrate-binding protein